MKNTTQICTPLNHEKLPKTAVCPHCGKNNTPTNKTIPLTLHYDVDTELKLNYFSKEELYLLSILKRHHD